MKNTRNYINFEDTGQVVQSTHVLAPRSDQPPPSGRPGLEKVRPPARANSTGATFGGAPANGAKSKTQAKISTVPLDAWTIRTCGNVLKGEHTISVALFFVFDGV